MMISKFFPPALLIFCLCALPATHAADDSFRAPDSLVLKDGTVVRGLILKNSLDAVLIQEQFQENSYPKSEIVRIRDEADLKALFTGMNKEGDLPSWRIIANDLRTLDVIKSLVEIPATIIDVGEFKNVPYKSFRVNDNIELNIYGDPDDPAGIEMGIYGWQSRLDKLRKRIRSYLVGFLTTRQEIAAMYSLGLEEGIKDAGELTIEVTPSSAPDAYGAWWISLYNKKALDAARLDDEEYAHLTRPVDEVIDRRGRVRPNAWSGSEVRLSKKADDNAPVMMRGFYRDKNGEFRLITKPAEAEARIK